MYDKEKVTWKGVPIKSLSLLSMDFEDRCDLFEAVREAHKSDGECDLEHYMLVSAFKLLDARRSDLLVDGIGEIEGKEGLHAWIEGSHEPEGQLIPSKFLTVSLEKRVDRAEGTAEELLSDYGEATAIERDWYLAMIQEDIQSGKDMAKWFRIYADRLDKVIPLAEERLASLRIIDK